MPKIVFLQNFGDVKNEVFKKRITFFGFVFFYVGEIATEKEKEMEKAPKPYKNSVFLRWSSKNVKNQKTDFLQKLPDTICVRKGEKRAFSCTLSVLAKNVFGPSFCFASCFLVVVVVFFCFLCFGVFLLILATYQKHLSKKRKLLKPKNEKCRKHDTGTRAVSTGVLTNSFFVLFCVSLKFVFLLKTL